MRTTEFFNNSTYEEMYISVEGMKEDGKALGMSRDVL